MQGVEFKGPVSGGEKRRLLASSLIYVAPNLGGESFGIVVAEGMAAGCAVVATNIPAFVEVTGGEAVHVPAGDARALAGALTSLLLDPAKARELGGSMRRRSAEYDWSAIVALYRDLYSEAIS